MPIINPYEQKFGSKGGWICESCGQWVPNGQLHRCLGKEHGETYIDARTIEMKVDSLMREVDELKTRITLLETLVDKIIQKYIGE